MASCAWPLQYYCNKGQELWLNIRRVEYILVEKGKNCTPRSRTIVLYYRSHVVKFLVSIAT
jgi:hypothetical protein